MNCLDPKFWFMLMALLGLAMPTCFFAQITNGEQLQMDSIGNDPFLPANSQVLQIDSSATAYREGIFDLIDYLYILPDSNGTFIIEEVAGVDFQDRFQPLTKEEWNKPHPQTDRFWLRLQISSNLEEQMTWFLSVNVPEVELFKKKPDGGFLSIHSGIALPFSQLPLKGKYGHVPYIPLQLEASTTQTFFLRILLDKTVTRPFGLLQQTDLKLIAPEKAAQMEIQIRPILGIFLGVILAVGIYHLIFYFFTFELVYLYFGFLEIALFGVIFHTKGFSIEYFFPETPYLSYTVGFEFFLVTLVLFFILLTREYFNIRQNSPVFDKVLKIIFALSFLLIISKIVIGLYNPAFILLYTQINNAAAFCLIVIFFLILSYSIYALIKGWKYAGSFVIAFLTFLLGSILGLLSANNFLKISIPADLPIALHSLCIAYGLAQRYRDTLKEKHGAEIQLQLEQEKALRLRELDTLKTKLYTNITHEFRTPLTVILGVTDQVKEQITGSAQEGLNMIRRNGLRLLNLVNQMLDLRKIESGMMPVKLVEGDILLYIKYILESFHSYAESKNIQLHFLSDLKALEMDYDPEKILTILSNLLSNAIKFTLEGGDVYLTVDGGRRTSDGSGEPTLIIHHSSLMIKVKDTGIGIPREKLPYIFDRFYQVDDEATRKAEGTGIGLALTKELVKLLGGDILVESDPDDTSGKKGTEFRIELPISREAELQETVDPLKAFETPEAVNADLLAVLSEPGVTEDQPLVLAIEDNSDVRSYLQACLSGSYHLILAEDGQKGIDQALEQVPDLIISDVMMPGKDGFEVCDALKNDERTSHIPIILLTAKADIESRLSGFKRGADAYLAKPFDKEELLVRMAALIEQRRKLQAYYLAQAVTGGVLPPTGGLTQEHTTENAFVQKVREIIKAHLDNPNFTVGQLCRDAALSQSQLLRKLKAIIGKPPSELIRSIRLAKARELLKDPEVTITEVAFDTGFNDPLYFSRVFRKEFGQSPSEFRREV